MAKFSIYYTPEEIEELCRLSPFNLKKDLKAIDKAEIDRIAEEIGNEVYNGIERPPTTVALYWAKGRKAAYAKVRAIDVGRKSGKSGGYRCIVLVDYINNAIFLLHIYRHGHGEGDDILDTDNKKLRKLVDAYVEALKEQKAH